MREKMKKSILPGDRLPDEGIDEAKRRCDRIMNPEEPQSIEAPHAWGRLTIESLTEELIQDSVYYLLLYQHPVHKYKDQLSRVSGSALKAFLKNCVVPDRMEGIDICILPHDDGWCVVCNHDGDIFFKTREFGVL